MELLLTLSISYSPRPLAVAPERKTWIMDSLLFMDYFTMKCSSYKKIKVNLSEFIPVKNLHKVEWTAWTLLSWLSSSATELFQQTFYKKIKAYLFDHGFISFYTSLHLCYGKNLTVKLLQTVITSSVWTHKTRRLLYSEPQACWDGQRNCQIFDVNRQTDFIFSENQLK